MVLGLGAVALSKRIYVAALIAIEALWLLGVIVIGLSPLWLHMTILQLAATVFSLLLRAIQIDAFKRSAAAQKLAAARTTELTAALNVLRHSESARRVSEERYRETSSLASDYIYSVTVSDPGLLLLDWATELSPLTGYTPAELSAHGGWLSIVHPDDRPAWLQRLSRLQQGHTDASEYRIVTKDGAVKWLRDYARPRYDELSDRVTGYTGAAKDISEQRAAEDALQLSERRYREVVDRAGEIIYETDADGRVTFCNDAVTRVIGFEPSDVIGRTLTDFVRPTHRRVAKYGMRRQLSGRALPTTIELPSTAKDGRTVWLGHTIQPMIDRNRSQGLQGIARDITERRLAQEELRRQKRLFENLYRVAHATGELSVLAETLQHTLRIAASLTGAASGSLFLVDERGEVTHSILAQGRSGTMQIQTVVKEVMADGLAGWVARQREPALVSDTLQDARWLSTPGQPYEVRSALAMPILRGPRLLGVLTLMHPSASHFGSAEQEFMLAATAQIALAVQNAQMYDAQKELAEQLSQARDAAEAANRAKSAFLATVSHELRTPLAVILGFVETLTDMDISSVDTLDVMRQGLAHIRRSAEQQLETVTAVLDYSRLESDPRPIVVSQVDPCDLVESVISEHAARAHMKGTGIECLCEPNLGLMCTDRTKLRQIIGKLIENAVKFTEAGRIQVLVSRSDRVGAQWRFRIKDTGVGMTDEQRARLFVPFAQGEQWMTRRAGGTGLGLVISKRLIERLGGTISVVSAPGQGSEFVVTLPEALQPVDTDVN
ncbi:MAG: PAS domain S-box protein [Chloroflexi bacterium]|nr:PAS domain S-box protein [Chloroflexota bacterium]